MERQHVEHKRRNHYDILLRDLAWPEGEPVDFTVSRLPLVAQDLQKLILRHPWGQATDDYLFALRRRLRLGCLRLIVGLGGRGAVRSSRK